MRLTQKQEKFVQEYITNGGNATQAYKTAYDCDNMKSAVINVKAIELLKNGKVSVRLQEHKEKLQKKFFYTTEQSFNKLEELQSLATAKANIQAALKAEELKGKLLGLYVEKHQIVSPKEIQEAQKEIDEALFNAKQDTGVN